MFFSYTFIAFWVDVFPFQGYNQKMTSKSFEDVVSYKDAVVRAAAYTVSPFYVLQAQNVQKLFWQ